MKITSPKKQTCSCKKLIFDPILQWVQGRGPQKSCFMVVDARVEKKFFNIKNKSEKSVGRSPHQEHFL